VIHRDFMPLGDEVPHQKPADEAVPPMARMRMAPNYRARPTGTGPYSVPIIYSWVIAKERESKYTKP